MEELGDVLSPSEALSAHELLASGWDEAVELIAAKPVWDRDHVVRLSTASGRTAILKRVRRGPDVSDRRGRGGFLTELASLTLLDSMTTPIAPRLLGADLNRGVLVMEDLPAGHSLADSLLTATREAATADVVSYARALAAIHAWSINHREAFETAGGSDAVPQRSWWVATARERQPEFLETAAEMGIDTAGVEAELEEVFAILEARQYRGFVHGDPCPDNVRIEDASGRCRLFDFELSSLGSVALDAGYLVAPFPSCWCFSPLPAVIVTTAMDAYRQEMQAGGVALGPDWDRAVMAAQACWLVARSHNLRPRFELDRDWGTTTMRPRLLTWLQSFSTACAEVGDFPSMHALARDLIDHLASAWPPVRTPSYPAFARSGSTVAKIPDWWRPHL